MGRRRVDNYLMGLMWKGKNLDKPYDLVDGTVALGCIHIGRDTHYNRIKETHFQGEGWNFWAMHASGLRSGFLHERQAPLKRWQIC